MNNPRTWWIVQTLLSYAIGEPVYNTRNEEPDELTKRTSAAIFPVVGKSDYDALAAELASTKSQLKETAVELKELRADNAALVEAAQEALRYIQADGRIGIGDRLEEALAKHGGGK